VALNRISLDSRRNVGSPGVSGGWLDHLCLAFALARLSFKLGRRELGLGLEIEVEVDVEVERLLRRLFCFTDARLRASLSSSSSSSSSSLLLPLALLQPYAASHSSMVVSNSPSGTPFLRYTEGVVGLKERGGTITTLSSKPTLMTSSLFGLANLLKYVNCTQHIQPCEMRTIQVVSFSLSHHAKF